MSMPAQRRRTRIAGLSAAALAALALVALPATAAAVTPSPSSFGWGSIDLHGPQAPALTITVTNFDLADAAVGEAVLGGADRGQFAIVADGCASAAVLAVGKSCDVKVVFAPTGAGAATTQLTVPSPSGDAVSALSATAVTGTLQASPSPIGFNPQPWYYGPTQQGVNIQSQGAGTKLGGLTLAGADASAFSFNFDSCSNTTVAAFSSCSLGLGFNPTGPGTRSAQLVVPSDSGSSPLVVPISATALAGPVTRVAPTVHS